MHCSHQHDIFRRGFIHTQRNPPLPLLLLLPLPLPRRQSPQQGLARLQHRLLHGQVPAQSLQRVPRETQLARQHIQLSPLLHLLLLVLFLLPVSISVPALQVVAHRGQPLLKDPPPQQRACGG